MADSLAQFFLVCSNTQIIIISYCNIQNQLKIKNLEIQNLKLQLREIEALTSASQTELKRTAEVYEDALTEISHLARDDMIELKSFQTPPPLVKTVMEAVCLLMGAPPDWESARRLLADNEARNRLAGLDKDRIPEKTLKTLQKWAFSFFSTFVPLSLLHIFLTFSFSLSSFFRLFFVLISRVLIYFLFGFLALMAPVGDSPAIASKNKDLPSAP